MAKQSGIHQLRGKVGEMSYYRTKGVQVGVVRRINQGMSQRVKSGDEFANTRLNNAEFKNANAIATAAFNSVNTRKRGMMRNFAVAEMTKRALEDIKQGTGSWGARKPLTEFDVLICDMLENYAKSGVYDGFFGIISNPSIVSSGAVKLAVNLSIEQQQVLLGMGIDGMQIIVSKCLAGEVLVDDAQRLYAGNGLAVFAPTVFDGEGAIEYDLSFNVGLPSDVGMSPSGYAQAQTDPNHGFYACLTFLPFREEGSKRYTLQEYCTFAAVPIGKIPE